MRQARVVQIVLAAVVIGMLTIVGYFISTSGGREPDDSIARRSTRRGSVRPTQSAVPDDRAESGQRNDGATDRGSVTPSPTPGVATDLPSPGARDLAADFTGSRFDRDQRRFSYGAKRVRELEDGSIEFLDDVRFETTAKSGISYELRAGTARASEDWKFVKATRSVEIVRSDGAALRADWAEHYEREKAEVVGGDVRAVSGSRTLACDRAEYRSETDEYLLDGSVILTDVSNGPASVTAEHLQYVRGGGQIFATDSVSVAKPGLAVHSHQMELLLDGAIPWRLVFRGQPDQDVMIESWSADEDCDEPQAWLKAAWVRGLEVGFVGGVARTLRPYPSGTHVYLEGLDAPTTLWSVVANGAEAKLDEQGRVDSITARHVLWRSAEVHSDGDPKESWYSSRLLAVFDENGELGEVELGDGLTFVKKDELRLTGQHATYSDDVLLVDVNPVLETDRSTLRSQRLEVNRVSGDLRARGRVEVESNRTMVAGGLMGGDGEPVKIRADEMDALDGGERITYRGQAQAWSGRDLLTADEIRVDRDLSGLEAEGQVVLLLESHGGLVEARASKLVFSDSVARLTGDVTIDAPDLSLQADEAELELAEQGGGFDVLDARGDEVIARRLNRTTYSRSFRHEVRSGRTILQGGARMARIVAPDGHESVGNVLTLWSDDQRVHIGSETEGFAQTRVDMSVLARPRPTPTASSGDK